MGGRLARSRCRRTDRCRAEGRSAIRLTAPAASLRAPLRAPRPTEDGQRHPDHRPDTDAELAREPAVAGALGMLAGEALGLVAGHAPTVPSVLVRSQRERNGQPAR